MDHLAHVYGLYRPPIARAFAAPKGRSRYYPQGGRDRAEPDGLLFAHVLAVDLERYRPVLSPGELSLVVLGEDAVAARRPACRRQHLPQRQERGHGVDAGHGEDVT